MRGDITTTTKEVCSPKQQEVLSKKIRVSLRGESGPKVCTRRPAKGKMFPSPEMLEFKPCVTGGHHIPAAQGSPETPNNMRWVGRSRGPGEEGPWVWATPQQAPHCPEKVGRKGLLDLLRPSLCPEA